MQRQVQECKDVNSIGWVGPSRHGNTNVVGIVDRRTSSDKDVPHRTSTLFRHYGEDHLRWVCLSELSCLQYLLSLQLKNRGRVSSLSIDSTHRTLPSVPCITTTLYLLLLHWRLPRAPHPLLPPQAQSPRLPCPPTPDHKHTSPPPPSSHRHPSLSAGGEARVSISAHSFERRKSSVSSEYKPAFSPLTCGLGLPTMGG
ncbi:hypothetical protein M405DRAFT_77036 [Rhizopogon salebrosus TDB-379]|nr:hypothetical protein M405DRAFT_77036 [Rhizopogon salebrosus TDB-379]